jgi:hypothetical protein
MAPDLLSTIRREIDERLRELHPLVAEHERLLGAADALVGTGREGSTAMTKTAPRATRVRKSPAKLKPARAVRGAAREAILAALEHGSHTVGELTVVTAMSGPNINGNLRRLLSEGAVVKTEREGKAAWALADVTI